MPHGFRPVLFTRLVGLILLGTGIARAQVCNPVCATQPHQCCAPVSADTFLAEECTGATSETVHFVLPGTGTGWVDQRAPATFTVDGLSGTVTLGTPPIQAMFQFTIGTSDASARFQVLEAATLSIIGQCVGTTGTTYVGLPKVVDFESPPGFIRTLVVSGRNPLFCRYTPTGGVQTDLLCLSVKGDVGAPFVAQALCDPDRVEFVCGVVP